MNKKAAVTLDQYTVFRLLCELGRGESSSQRDLARRLDSALGLVNGYLKACTDKGWVRVRELGGNRSSYQLTGKGLQEQRRLALRHAGYLPEILAVVLSEYREIARKLADQGVERVALCGADGITDIVAGVLREQAVEVLLVMDSAGIGNHCLGKEVVSLAHAMLSGVNRVVISSLARGRDLRDALLELGCEPEAVYLPQLFLDFER